jgi:hypothetical protein
VAACGIDVNRLLAGKFAPIALRSQGRGATIRGLYFGIGPVVFYGNLETTPAGDISTYTRTSSATTQNLVPAQTGFLNIPPN